MEYDYYQMSDGSYAIMDEVRMHLVKYVSNLSAAREVIYRLNILTDSDYSKMTEHEYSTYINEVL
tara:strand:+ start:710 stop:904 length:195 start_codon:yes stop_codon:yes gene_type:complete